MDLKQLAELKKNQDYKKIADWADSEGVENLENGESLLFAGEAWEHFGEIQKAEEAYLKSLKEYEEELAAERLLDIYKGANRKDELRALIEFLEESGLADPQLMLAQFEVLRIEGASLQEQFKVLKEYVEEYYDELYYILMLELILESGDTKECERYIGKFHTMFRNTRYQIQLDKIEQALLQGNSQMGAGSVRRLIYKKQGESQQKQEKSIPSIVPQTAPTQKVRIKTKGLGDLIRGNLFTNASKKPRTQNQEPPTMDERFKNIVGMQEVRAQVGGIYRVFKLQRERQSADFNSEILNHTHFSISGKRGSGKTLLAETIGQMLVDFGIRGEEDAVSIEAKDFIDNYAELDKLDDITLIIEGIDRTRDEMGKYGDFAWKLRKFLIDHRSNISVILTGSEEAVQSLFAEEKEIKENIYSQLSISDYSLEELVEIAKKILFERKWRLHPDAAELLKKQITREMRMPTFYIGKSLLEKIREAERKAADRIALMDDIEDDDIVTLMAEDFEQEGMDKSVPQLLEELDKLTGLSSVKEQVNSLISKIMTAKEAEKAGAARGMTSEPLHLIFKGNPGTGKTTVARIIAQIYQALGVLPGNAEGLVEVSGLELTSEYIGMTKTITQAAIDRAMGGVLFVDEAYSLTQVTYGDEAITTLLKAMEDCRDSFMVIFAGYTEQIDQLLDKNPGLRSRMPRHLMFEDYNEDEMFSIFKGMVSADHRVLDKDTTDVVKELIRSRSKGQDFGNARGVRNLVGMVETALDERIFEMISDGKQPTTNDYEIIRRQDVEAVLNHSTDGSKTLEELLDDLYSMEGLSGIKEVVRRNVNAVKAIELRKNVGMDANLDLGSLHMVFLGGPGTGKTTVARKIGYIYKALGILPRGDEVIECSRPEMVAEFKGGTAKKVKELMDHAMGGVLFIDEAYTLSRDKNDDFGLEAIDTLVKTMEDKRDSFMVILAGYTDEMNQFLDSNPGLRSRIGAMVEFADFTPEQMKNIFCDMAGSKGYTIEPPANSLIERLLRERSAEKDFGNARGVRNVFKQLCLAIDARIVECGANITAEECKTIKAEDVRSLLKDKTTENEASVEELLQQLDQMIGLQSVKDKVHAIVKQTRYLKWEAEMTGKKGGYGNLHMLFKGNAGTGKTTVARLIGQIYKQMGVSRTGAFVECDRNDLVVGYVGQTGDNTRKFIEKAMGGILFVDEAYTLIKENDSNDFGKEALDAIMTEMENHRDDLIVIFAGYSQQLDKLLDSNQGLESRFSKQNEIIFEDYTDEELLQIFRYQSEKAGMVLDKELEPLALEKIRAAKANARNFGNARGIRNLVTAVNGARQQRISDLLEAGVSPDLEESRKLIVEDFAVI